MNRKILYEVLQELKSGDIRVRINYLLEVYANLQKPKGHALEIFFWGKFKEWIQCIRESNKEDLYIERKTVLEVRRLPLHAWSEENLN